MPRYEVEVCRISYSKRKVFTVEAPDTEAAKRKVLDIAGNFTYQESHAEYEADEVYELGEA